MTPCLILMSVAGESRESDESNSPRERGGERRAVEFVSVKKKNDQPGSSLFERIKTSSSQVSQRKCRADD